MLFYQVEYTSCRVGEHAGFQVSAATPGIEAVGQADMDEVIRLGYYRPPEKTAAPPAFRAMRLSSGRQLLQHSRYLGCDDTGREGNFLTRSLVSSAAVPLPAWTIDYSSWPGWVAPHEPGLAVVAAQTPPPLPPVQMENLHTGSSFSHAELAAFIQQHPHRADWLRFMLALLFMPLTGRRLAVRDDAANHLQWLACLTKLLPRPVANTLALSTRQPEPGGFDICGLSPMDAAGVRAGLNIVDVCDAVPPKELPIGVPASGRVYSRKVVDLLLRRPEAMSGFLRGLGGIIHKR